MTTNAHIWRTDDDEALDARTLAELEAAGIERGRPVVAVDADEVLVHFAEHFGQFCAALDVRFELTEYRLDTALLRSDGTPLDRSEIQPLIWRFINEETGRQPVVAGAAEALNGLAREAQVVIVTNAPASVRADRVANLAGHGMNFPVVMNEGGKGRALRWLVDRADAPVAFVDDSVVQHGSVAKRAPETTRFHFVGSEMLRGVIGAAETAHAHPDDWAEAEAMIRAALADGV